MTEVRRAARRPYHTHTTPPVYDHLFTGRTPPRIPKRGVLLLLLLDCQDGLSDDEGRSPLAITACQFAAGGTSILPKLGEYTALLSPGIAITALGC